MPYCTHCGHELNASDRFCANCGTKVAGAPDTEEETARPRSAFERTTQRFSAKATTAWRNAMDTEDHTADFEEDDIAQNSGFALIAYLGPFLLVPLFGSGKSRFARFHINQSLCLIVSFLVYSLLLALALALLQWIPGFDTVFATAYHWLEIIGGVGTILLALRGIYNANHGLARELPFVGRFQLIHP